MIKPKTYFKQIPLKIVKKIVEQQAEQEEVAVLPTRADHEKTESKSRGRARGDR